MSGLQAQEVWAHCRWPSMSTSESDSSEEVGHALLSFQTNLLGSVWACDGQSGWTGWLWLHQAWERGARLGGWLAFPISRVSCPVLHSLSLSLPLPFPFLPGFLPP